MPVAIADHGAERQAVDDGARSVRRLSRAGEAEEAGGEREQAEDADDAEQAEEEQDEVGRDVLAERLKPTATTMKTTASSNDAPQAGKAGRRASIGSG